MKEVITYIIKAKTDFDDLYIYNKPSGNNPKIVYTNEKADAKEFNGMEKASMDMTKHKAIKRVYPASYEIDLEEVDNEFSN